MSALREVLGFLAKPYVWFTVVALILVWTGVLMPAEVKEIVTDTIGAVKDWSPLGGAP